MRSRRRTCSPRSAISRDWRTCSPTARVPSTSRHRSRTRAAAVAEANARLASLRAQLAHANAVGDFTTAQQLIRKIRETSFQLDRDKAELRQLERRAKYATVDVTVVSDSSGGDGWTFSDAVHDAGDVLRYAAGITVVSAAVLLPVALLAALVSLVWHARVRRSREARAGRRVGA